MQSMPVQQCGKHGTRLEGDVVVLYPARSVAAECPICRELADLHEKIEVACAGAEAFGNETAHYRAVLCDLYRDGTIEMRNIIVEALGHVPTRG